MGKENISQEFRLRNINEARNCFLKEIEQNKLTSKKHKKFSTTLIYVKHFSYFGFSNYWMYFNF